MPERGQAEGGAQASVRKAGKKRSEKAVSPEAVEYLLLDTTTLDPLIRIHGSPEGRDLIPRQKIW